MSDEARARLRAGGLRGAELVAWIAEREPENRDAAVEELLGIRRRTREAPIDAQRMGYMPSAIAPIVSMLATVPVTPDDVFVDLGAGLGKVAMAVRLLAGATVRGIELLPDLADAARAAARDLALDRVTFVAADALEADLEGATVVFLYLPFTGDVLAGVMQRLRAVAAQRQIVICTLGLDLRGWEWLVERQLEDFWLSVYDSRVPGAAPRPAGPQPAFGPLGDAVARERRKP